MPNRKEPSKAENEKLLELVHDLKIHFIPAITLADWDRDGLPCRNLFEQILQIQTIKFSDYPQQDHRDSEGAHQKKLLVRRIQASAARCKREKDNEAGWINNVANLVLERLDGYEFHCQRCHQYLWLPDFVALPSDRVAADRLERRYARRKLCKCTAAERAEVVRVNYVRACIFSNKSDERVMHGDSGLDGEQLDQKYKRPDRVYGLGMTSSFLHFREVVGRYSPFTGRHTLFPFLIFEAKSEKSGQGFEQIETQTALSIRTCLRLQVDLEQDSHQILDPVVWFFGSKGEEWRLYIACMVGGATKIVDCWHGFIQNADQALQLLLLVDWISGWAKDVHRPGVVRCLTRLSERETSPTVTVFSSQGDGAFSQPATRSNSLSRPSSPTPEIQPETAPVSSISGVIINLEDSDDVIMVDSDPDDHLFASDGTDSSDSGDVEDTRVIRNACSVLCRWQYLDIPEEESVLLELLGIADFLSRPHTGVKFLLHMLLAPRYTLLVRLKTVTNLFQDSTDQAVQESESNEPVFTSIVCQRRLVETSWQVMCNFWCVTCTQAAFKTLAKIAGLNKVPNFALSNWRIADNECDSLASVIADMERLDGKMSAMAAIKQDIFCVVSSACEARTRLYEWRTLRLRHRFTPIERLFGGHKGVRQNSLPAAISCSSSGGSISPDLFETDTLHDLPGVILKRPASWPKSCPFWCFLKFDNAQQESIEAQIAKAYRRKAIFATEKWDHDEELLRFPERWRE